MGIKIIQEATYEKLAQAIKSGEDWFDAEGGFLGANLESSIWEKIENLIESV